MASVSDMRTGDGTGGGLETVHWVAILCTEGMVHTHRCTVQAGRMIVQVQVQVEECRHKQSLTDRLWMRTCPWEVLLKRVLSPLSCGGAWGGHEG